MRITHVTTALLLVVAMALGQPGQPPGEKGRPYPAPGRPDDLKREVLWGSRCEEPPSQGLAFSGQSQSAPDGQPHTRIKVDGEWKPIGEDLRIRNWFQTPHDKFWRLRTRLKDAATKVRFIFFEGRPVMDEKKFLDAQVNPELKKLHEELSVVVQYFLAIGGKEDFGQGQMKFAVQHIEAGVKSIGPVVAPVTPEMLAALRQAQQQLEIAAEALDAEPAPRVCSPIVYDPQTKFYVLFGGDHFDYLTNDTWVFDPAKQQWFQRHPNGAPTPRADHQLRISGAEDGPARDGKVTLSGGYTYSSKTDYGSNQYCHVGEGEWVYDVAKNTWQLAPGEHTGGNPGEHTGGNPPAATQPADSRVYRTGAYLPEHFMADPRPDAAANEAKLKALPANAWTKMGVPQFLYLNRDWGTAALDTDRDMIIYWSGGHCVHSGSDVPHYHLATNRWELHFPIEMPLGFIGASGIGVGGRNFNGRPWMSNHTDNCYAYDSGLKKLVVVGRNNRKLDGYTYLYDPDLGDWTERIKVPDGMNIANMEVNVRSCASGVLAWTRDPARLWLLDRSKLTWAPMKVDGLAALPAPMVDNCGLVYDPKAARDRMLFVHKMYGEKSLFNGKIYALDFKTSKLETLTPAGADQVDHVFSAGMAREAVYDPQSDLFLWAAWLPSLPTAAPDGAGKNPRGDRMLAYDPAANRWVGAKVTGPAPFDVSTALAYDPKRKLVWLVHGSSQAGEVYVLRFDPATADIKPVAQLPAPASPAGAGSE